MSAGTTPAEAMASPGASTSSSSAPLSQCSPKGVQPIPTMATWSRMPLDAIARPSSRGYPGPRVISEKPPAPGRSCLPEVVVDAVGGGYPPEGHLHPVADPDRLRFEVGELAL